MMTSSPGELTFDLTDDEADRHRCTLCDSVSRTDPFASTSVPRHRVQRPWPPNYGLGTVDQVASSRLSSSPRVVSCRAAVAAGSVHCDVVRPLEVDTVRSSALFSQLNSVTQPCVSAASTAAVVTVQPYFHRDDNIGALDTAALPAAGLSQQWPDVHMSVGKSSVSLPRPSTSTSTRPQYDRHNHTALTTRKTRNVVQEFGSTKLTPRKYLSKSCPNIRLVSQPRRRAVMSTFGKSRPAVQYDCITDDCCNVAEKIFGFENSVYLGGREVDFFNETDAMHAVSESATGRDTPSDRTRLTSHQTYQSTYGTLHDAARAARMRAFLSSDASGKRESVVTETSRLNSAVCKPIITTRHHKVSIFSCFTPFTCTRPKL